MASTGPGFAGLTARGRRDPALGLARQDIVPLRWRWSGRQDIVPLVEVGLRQEIVPVSAARGRV